MPLDRRYANEIVDLLQTLGHVTGRAMFGGFGIWEKGAMFAVLDSDSVLYFKTNAESETDYRAAGSLQFAPQMPGRSPHPMPYWSVPAEVLDDQETLETWALRAIRIAHANKQNSRARQSTSASLPAPKPTKPRPATLPPKKKASPATTEAPPAALTQPQGTRQDNPNAPVPSWPANETKVRNPPGAREATTTPKTTAREPQTRATPPRRQKTEKQREPARSRGSASSLPTPKKETTTTEHAETRAPEKRPARRGAGRSSATAPPKNTR